MTQRSKPPLPAFRGDIQQIPRRRSRRSRWRASAPTTSPAPGRPPVLAARRRPGRPVRADRAGSMTRTSPSSRWSPARASTCAAWRATWPPACGTLGHIVALRRLRVGPFTEAQAISLDKLMPARTICPQSFPGPAASGHDRAGRHPGAGPDRSRGRGPVTWPGDQPGVADGPYSADRRSQRGAGARHGGEPRDRLVPPR